ncbi:GNAT family N-acetyltransferase [Streptococcus zalophi]|uniref:GNAT family N-acetyltransferase n=1 Tax=Streptococcus zalophi TaxID=640031 RepID=A0A934UE21_9STRE|nr:GNAT family N-acetyltransferase [Streptococcus zalophi]MBJ8350268.1 GNAT family N-acetyltransferase [Streptococcus zalophi]MCR8967489.1 GNAT family N-acetyltransferase [Streptococcus zalophi]
MKQIETKRLIIRAPQNEDFEALYAIHSNPLTNLYNPNGPIQNRIAFQQIFDEWLLHHRIHGFGYYVLIDKEDSSVFGLSGLKFVTIKDEEYLNLYYRITPEKTRRGFVKEAAQEIITTVLRELDNKYAIVALTLDTNLPSRKTAESLGLVYNPQLDNYKGQGNVYYFSQFPT